MWNFLRLLSKLWNGIEPPMPEPRPAWNIAWDEDGRQAIHGVDDLDLILDQIHQEYLASELPVAVYFEGPTGHMWITLGDANGSVVTFSSSEGEFVSVGERSFHKGKYYVNSCGAETELLVKALVPVQMARRAVRDFFLLGSRSETITWTDA